MLKATVGASADIRTNLVVAAGKRQARNLLSTACTGRRKPQRWRKSIRRRDRQAKTHILNLLHRLTDGKSPVTSTVEAPHALTLTQEPRADVERYDALRNAEQEARHAS